MTEERIRELELDAGPDSEVLSNAQDKTIGGLPREGDRRKNGEAPKPPALLRPKLGPSLAALVLMACDPVVAGRVCLIGDSNSAGLLGPLHVAVSAGRFEDGEWRQRERSELLVPVASMPGARMDISLESGWIAGRLATSGVICDQAVISLGANDIGAYESSSSELDARMDELLALLPQPVLWIAPAPTSAEHPQERVAEWRMALWRAEQRWPGLEVQDAPTEWLSPDGVHFSVEGYGQLAAAVADRLLGMVP